MTKALHVIVLFDIFDQGDDSLGYLHLNALHKKPENLPLLRIILDITLWK